MDGDWLERVHVRIDVDIRVDVIGEDMLFISYCVSSVFAFYFGPSFGSLVFGPYLEYYYWIVFI